MQNSGDLIWFKNYNEIIHNSSGTSLLKDILGIFNIDNLEML